MKSGHKMVAVIAVWFLVAALAAATIQEVGDSWVAVGLAAIYLLMALGGTFIVTSMSSTTDERVTRNENVRRFSKAKNSDTALVDRLLGSMSEAELSALRQRLATGDDIPYGDDGDVISFEEALNSRRR